MAHAGNKTDTTDKKLVIFDLDGTLVDSMPDIVFFLNLMLKKYGLSEVSIDDAMDFIGYGARKLVSRCLDFSRKKTLLDSEKLKNDSSLREFCEKPALSEEEIDERLAFYNANYSASNSPRTRVYDGIKELLVSLKQRGFYLAILSNKPQETLDSVYQTYLKDFNFDICLGMGTRFPRKPAPDSTLFIIDTLKVKKENVIFVGDEETDVLVAKNSGIKGVSVLWGYRGKEELVSAGATVFAENAETLSEIIK